MPLSLVAFFAIWSVWLDQLCRVWRVTLKIPSCTALVDRHFKELYWPEPLNALRGLNWEHRGIRGDTDGLLLAVATVGGCWDVSPGSWRAASGGGTWLWRPCHSRRQVRSSTGCEGMGILSHTYRLKMTGGHKSIPSHSRPHAMTSRCGWM